MAARRMGKVHYQIMIELKLSTFGRLHTHPTSGQPKEYPQFHLVYHDDKSSGKLEYNRGTLSGTGWHSDVT